MRQILREFGSDLVHGARLDQFYPSLDPVAAYHLARKACFGDDVPPSTSVVMERCFAAGSTISSSLIAVVPGRDYAIERVQPPGVTSPELVGLCPGRRLQ
jgi:hypothetical protein